jgi:hypothetical protein
MDSDVLVIRDFSKSIPTTMNVSGFAPLTLITLYFVAMGISWWSWLFCALPVHRNSTDRLAAENPRA